MPKNPAQNEHITPEPLPACLGPSDLRALFGVTEPGLNSLIRAGALPQPVVNCGRIRRWNRDAVLAVLNGGGQ